MAAKRYVITCDLTERHELWYLKRDFYLSRIDGEKTDYTKFESVWTDADDRHEFLTKEEAEAVLLLVPSARYPGASVRQAP